MQATVATQLPNCVVHLQIYNACALLIDFAGQTAAFSKCQCQSTAYCPVMQYVADQMTAAIDIHSSRTCSSQQHSISRCLRSNIFQFQLAVITQFNACSGTTIRHVQVPTVNSSFRTASQLDAYSISAADLYASGTI